MMALALALLVLQEPTAVRAAPASELAASARAALERFVAAGKVPGVSAGLATSEETLALAAGVAERETKRALEPGDLLCAGSTGKTFVAAVVLQLVQEGKLRLSDFAGDHLGSEPWFEHLPNAAELTLENLLDHRSGLPRYEFQPEFARDLRAQPDRVWKPAELLGYVLDHEPENAAGAGFAYADTNYIVLGMIVEKVTGHALYAEVQERLLEPLALAHVRPQDARSIRGLVQGHAGKRDPLGAPELVLDGAGRYYTNPQFEWAGGGFVTSGGDLARWARALYGGDVLGAELRTRMLTGLDAPELGRGVRYGLGAILWDTEHGPACGHQGFFPGYMSEVRFWPAHGIAVALQVNTSDPRALSEPLGRLCEELLGLALAAAPASTR